MVWNVVAAPEFSLEPEQWCFPVAGCVSYRGYFSRDGAEGFADGLRAKGMDVHVYGVAAYSTLNWFDDPVLNTFCHRPEPHLAGLIFHELAHQKLYVANDSSFNEAFAKTVELEGVHRWLRQRGNLEQEKEYFEDFAREEEFVALVLKTREQLSELYASPLDALRKRQEKQRVFNELRAEYRRLKASWGGYAGYDRWFDADLNNARLASISTYRTLVPAFRELLARNGGDLGRFYAEAEKIGKLPFGQRARATAELLEFKSVPAPVGRLERERKIF